MEVGDMVFPSHADRWQAGTPKLAGVREVVWAGGRNGVNKVG